MYPYPYAIVQNTGTFTEKVIETNFPDRWAAEARLSKMRIKPIKDPVVRGLEHEARVRPDWNYW